VRKQGDLVTERLRERETRRDLPGVCPGRSHRSEGLLQRMPMADAFGKVPGRVCEGTKVKVKAEVKKKKMRKSEKARERWGERETGRNMNDE